MELKPGELYTIVGKHNDEYYGYCFNNQNALVETVLSAIPNNSIGMHISSKFHKLGNYCDPQLMHLCLVFGSGLMWINPQFHHLRSA